MATTDIGPELTELLDAAYLGKERRTPGELRRYAVEAELPADAMALLDALPEGEYAQDEAVEALHQIPILHGNDRT